MDREDAKIFKSTTFLAQVFGEPEKRIIDDKEYLVLKPLPSLNWEELTIGKDSNG